MDRIGEKMSTFPSASASVLRERQKDMDSPSKIATRSKCIASSNKCLTTSNKKLLGTSASLLVTSALLLVTRS